MRLLYCTQKLFDISLALTLAEIFRAEINSKLIFLLSILCAYAVVAKIIGLFVAAMPATRAKPVNLTGIAHCCQNINNEIKRHIEAIRADPKFTKTSLTQAHHFQLNLGLITKELASHIKSTLTGARETDVFVSVYRVPNYQELKFSSGDPILEYVCHHPMEKDGISSIVIDTGNAQFSKYECVKCVRSSDLTVVKVDCSDYHKSNSHRHKNIKHYIGMKLIHANGSLLGFINIELYGTKFFADEEEMRSYLERSIMGFRYLIEYQFLKGVFFKTLQPTVK